jgi:hypothetical protein
MSEKAMPFNQIGGRFPLLAIKPAGYPENQPTEDRHVNHERQRISRKPFDR